MFLDEVAGSDSGGGVLVVDDADVILESPSVEALDYLISSLAETTRVVLLSRAEVPLGSQAKRLLEGHAARVMAEDLLFRRDEIGAFAATVFRVELSEDEVDRLYRATGGWAIALSLALRLRDLGTSMQTDEHAQFTPEARADLFSYLAAEVLSRVDERISGFLRQTAILDELDPSICGRITGEERPVEVIQSLARAGLPVVKSGWGTYRCHSLLREYFLHTLNDEEVRQSHSEAGRAFAGIGNWPQALHHFVAAGDTDAALGLIDEHGRELFHAGHGRALLDLVKTASSDQLAGHYRAEYWAAFAASRMFDLDWAAAALERVSEEAKARGDDGLARDALRALAYLLNGWGRFEPAMVVARQLRDSVPEHETASRAAITLGYLTTGMGATEQFRESLELTRTQLPLLAVEPRADAVDEAFARAVAGVTLAFEGDFAAGRAELNQADMLMSGHEDDVVATFMPWSRALVEFQAGNPDAADDATHIAEAMALRFGDLQRVLECRAIRASTAVLRDNVDEADRGFAQLDDLRAGGTDFWGILFGLLSRPHRLRLHGDLAGARNAAEANNALATATASAWFMCSTRLDVANFRLLTGDGEGACEPARAALAEAVAMSADVLLYGAHLMIAATGADDEEAAMAEALRIADVRDYRFLMPYGVRLPELDAALWRGAGDGACGTGGDPAYGGWAGRREGVSGRGGGNDRRGVASGDRRPVRAWGRGAEGAAGPGGRAWRACGGGGAGGAGRAGRGEPAPAVPSGARSAGAAVAGFEDEGRGGAAVPDAGDRIYAHPADHGEDEHDLEGGTARAGRSRGRATRQLDAHRHRTVRTFRDSNAVPGGPYSPHGRQADA